jgi:16S rRNA (guanine1207-N2)-methyltransferase
MSTWPHKPGHTSRPARRTSPSSARPPYYSNYRIAEVFLDAGRRALRPGGTILVVAKRPDWYLESMPARFERVAATPVRDYVVISAVQPS